MNKNQNKIAAGGNTAVKQPAPVVIAVHSYNGKPMKEGALKKFVDGAITTADNVAQQSPGSTIAEEEWVK
jgi:hypothetical protein